MKVRWCTGKLKTHLINKEVNRLKGEHNALHYVGIAADEAEALKICYDHGFDFGGLYDIYHRASCWCCPLQRIDELRKLRRHHPELWARLLDMDNRAREMFGSGPLGQFKQNWSVERLGARFLQEDEKQNDGQGGEPISLGNLKNAISTFKK